MQIKVTLPGNKRVDAHLGNFVIHTDQKLRDGGEESAPTPFDTFLASLGTCAGIYVSGFCESRGISHEGIEIIENVVYDPAKRGIGKIQLEIQVPSDFPEKYHSALVNAANLCAVKRLIENPPEFETYTIVK